MEKFKYGPLIWNSANEDDESGNYFWNGKPPVDYDREGIPIDDEGMQCLPIDSPVHPSWTCNNLFLVYNDFLEFEIPSIDSTREWFDDNFLIVSDKQCKKYIIRWIRMNRKALPGFAKMTAGASSLVEMMDRVWPQDDLK
tara:strand:- start:41 stop:460 length:420 start_codon:yes stop_codon:yes gene_type:complete